MAKRVSVVLVSAALFLGMVVSAAWAVQYGPFTKDCGSQYVRVTSLAQYEVKHYYPSNTLRVIFDNSGGAVTRHTHTGTNSTSWKVVANDAIWVPQTNANCVSIG